MPASLLRLITAAVLAAAVAEAQDRPAGTPTLPPLTPSTQPAAPAASPAPAPAPVPAPAAPAPQPLTPPPATAPGAGAAPAAPPAGQPGGAGIVQANTDQLMGLAAEARAAGRLSEALDMLRLAVQTAPQNLEARLQLGETAVEANHWESARGVFKEVLDREPGNYRANIGMGKIWLGANLPRQALSFLLQAERVAPASQANEVQRLLAMCYRATDPGKAMTTLEAILQRDPRDLDAMEQLVQLRREHKQIEQAAQDAERLVRMAAEAVAADPGNEPAVQRLLDAYETQLAVLGIGGGTRLDGLLQTMYEKNARGQTTDRVIAGREKDVVALMSTIADKLASAGKVRLTLQYHQSIIVLTQAVQLDPGNVTLLKQLGSFLVETGQRQRAAEAFQRVLELAPGDPEAAGYLGQLQTSR